MKKRLPTANCEGCRYFVNFNREKVVFSLFHMVDGFYSLVNCESRDQLAFVDKMNMLSNMTWEEVLRAPRHGAGIEKINVKSIHAPLPRYITQDVKLIAFRFSGMKPMVGFRDRNIFLSRLV